MTTRRGGVTVRDLGWERIKRDLGSAVARAVRVGVQGPEGAAVHDDSDGLTNAQLAAIHEFGTATVPERSFIRATIEAHGREYERILGAEAAKIIAGRSTVERSLTLLGMRVEGDMKATIEAGIPPPLAPVTVAAKGSSQPLIDSGQLRNSITSKVVEGDQEPES
jgi:phage gpG-like protein